MRNWFEELSDLRGAEDEKRHPNATPAEDLERVGRRRSLRLVKAWTAAIMVAPFVIPSVINTISRAAEKLSSKFSDSASFPNNEDAKLVPQINKPEPQKSSLSERLWAVFDAVVKTSYIVYSGIKGVQAHKDKVLMEHLQDEKDAYDWRNSGKKSSEPPSGPKNE